jgi:hypothetical protein
MGSLTTFWWDPYRSLFTQLWSATCALNRGCLPLARQIWHPMDWLIDSVHGFPADWPQQKTIIVEMTVIRVFFIFVTSLFSQANDWSFLTAFPCKKKGENRYFSSDLFQASRRLKIWRGKNLTIFNWHNQKTISHLPVRINLWQI